MGKGKVIRSSKKSTVSSRPGLTKKAAAELSNATTTLLRSEKALRDLLKQFGPALSEIVKEAQSKSKSKRKFEEEEEEDDEEDEHEHTNSPTDSESEADEMSEGESSDEESELDESGESDSDEESDEDSDDDSDDEELSLRTELDKFYGLVKDSKYEPDSKRVIMRAKTFMELVDSMGLDLFPRVQYMKEKGDLAWKAPSESLKWLTEKQAFVAMDEASLEFLSTLKKELMVGGIGFEQASVNAIQKVPARSIVSQYGRMAQMQTDDQVQEHPVFGAKLKTASISTAALVESDLIRPDTQSTRALLRIGTHHAEKSSGKVPVATVGLVMSAAARSRGLLREAPSDESEEHLLAVTLVCRGTPCPKGRTPQHKALINLEAHFEKLDSKRVPRKAREAQLAVLRRTPIIVGGSAPGGSPAEAGAGAEAGAEAGAGGGHAPPGDSDGCDRLPAEAQVCLRALTEGLRQVEVVRARASFTPRESSLEVEGLMLDASWLLDDLRRPPGEAVGAVPGGPGSGITVRIPRHPRIGGGHGRGSRMDRAA